MNKNKYKTIENSSGKNNYYIKASSSSKPKKKIKKGNNNILPIPAQCYFTKSLIEIDSKNYNLLNTKNKILSIDLDKNFSNNEEKYQSSGEEDENNYFNKGNLYNDNNFNNYNKYFNNKEKKNNYQNFNSKNNFSLNSNNYYDINSKYNKSDRKKLFDSKAFNNNINNRLVSPNILISKNVKNNKNKYQKKLTEIPLSPYIQSKINLKKPINKNNSVLNIVYNKKNSEKYPSINKNNLRKNSSSSNLNVESNNINVNFYKTDTIFNYQPKNNVIIPISSSNKRIDSFKSVNTNKLQNNNLKMTELSTPISVEPTNKLTFDIKAFHNLKKGGHEKGYGKHYGNEKECPICQSILMKNNYLMKKMNHYNDSNYDHQRIKNKKEQFLQELKKPNTRIQREEANIMKQIRQFLSSSKSHNNYYDNNIVDEDNVINAYFGL